MTIVSHSHKFILLRTRKTAGSALESWLARQLDPNLNIASLGPELVEADPQLTVFSNQAPYLRRKLNGLLGRPIHLKPHMRAAGVRCIVGSNAWRSYRKITVVRNPWDYLISFWRWRQHKFGLRISLDDFLSMIETSPAEPAVKGWLNWPIYTIEDQIVADDVIRYEELTADLARY
jgi:hypothetical protein